MHRHERVRTPKYEGPQTSPNTNRPDKIRLQLLFTWDKDCWYRSNEIQEVFPVLVFFLGSSHQFSRNFPIFLQLNVVSCVLFSCRRNNKNPISFMRAMSKKKKKNSKKAFAFFFIIKLSGPAYASECWETNLTFVKNSFTGIHIQSYRNAYIMERVRRG